MNLALTMGVLGFESARQSKLRHLLPKINCSGTTAFRDAVVKGNELMLQLFGLFIKEGIHDKFQFVHVVLTDGADSASEISHLDFLNYQLYINSQLPPSILKTFYIGVNLESDRLVTKQMLEIIGCSGEAAQYYPISSNGINDIFQKIQMQIGIQIQQRHLLIQNKNVTVGLMQEQYNPIIQLKVNNYIVLFTLDISGSMSSSWNRVCSSVSNFLDNLGENDLVMGIIFNEEVQILTAQNANIRQSHYQEPYQENKPKTYIKDQQVKNEDYCCYMF